MPRPHMQHSSMSLAMEQPTIQGQHTVIQPDWERRKRVRRSRHSLPPKGFPKGGIKRAHKFRSRRSNQTGRSQSPPACSNSSGICLVGGSQPWSLWARGWQASVWFWASEIVDRNEGWRFGSYQVMEVKDKQNYQRSSPGSQTKSEGQWEGGDSFMKGGGQVFPWQRSVTHPYFL